MKTFTSSFNMNRHTLRFHGESKPKYLKHLKVGRKFKCKACDKVYAYSRDLRKHYLKDHNHKELDEAGVEIHSLVKPRSHKLDEPEQKTDLERLAEEEKRAAGLHIDEENWKRVLELEYHAPILKLLAMQCAE